MDGNHPPIQVWRFHDAPKELRDLSPHGGDEDWVALVPPGYRDAPWLDCRHFGVSDTSEHELPNGNIVFIGAHA